MATLYLDRKDLELRQESTCLSLYEEGERRGTIPLNLVERVVLRGRATLSSGVLGLLADQGVGMLVLSGRQSRRVAMLLGKPHGDVARRVGQYRWYHDPETRLPLARALVIAKLRAQRRFLAEALTRRPDCRSALGRAQTPIDAALRRLRTEPDWTLPALRGVEGAAAAAYFGGLTALFAPSLNFTGRNRRPPRDPVNAVLSLTYTLLHFDAVLACHAAGLDPFVGFFHELAYNRESLAADFIEPLRPRADAWVWRLFADRRVRADHFAWEGEACVLKKAGREAFYGGYEEQAKPLRRWLRRYTTRLGQRLAEAIRPCC